jgi:lactoylglutathione lyase
MEFGYIIIYVDDVKLTMDFYINAFNLQQEFLHENLQYGELKTGNTKIAFASNKCAESNGLTFTKNNAKNPAAGFEIGFVTKDVEHAYSYAIKHGAIPIKEPMSKPWGQIVGYVRDLNGVIVEIATPMF